MLWRTARRPLLGGTAVLPTPAFPEPLDMADPRARADVRARYERIVARADAPTGRRRGASDFGRYVTPPLRAC